MAVASAAPSTTGAGSAELERRLGARDAALLTVGSVVGTGVFLTTADIARRLPHAGWIVAVWVAGGLLSLAGALTYAEMGTMFPRAGGQYHYLREAFGPLTGFLFGWTCFLCIFSGGIAAIAVGFGTYLGGFVPFFGVDNVLARVSVGAWTWTFNGTQLAAILAILALTAINARGLAAGAGTQNLLTVAKAGAIGFLVVVGLVLPARVDADWTGPVPLAGGSLVTLFGAGMIAALWTYDGWYGATYSAGEIRDPGRNLPRGLIAGTLAVTLLYVAVNVVYAWALTPAEMAQSARVGEAAAAAMAGATAAKWVAAAVLVSTFGCLAATVLYCSRLYPPMAEDGVFFRAVARIDPATHVPVRSLWLQAGWSIALTASGTYEQLYTYVIFAGLVFHAATGAALFVLRARRPDAVRPYRVWGYPVVPLAFIGASLVLVANTLWTSPTESLAGLGLVALGLPAYALWRRSAPAAP
jgi:APA family basic amino acid/polyamine antiporter